MKDRLALSLLVVGLLAVSVLVLGLSISPSLGQDQREIYWTGQDVVVDTDIDSETTYALYNESGDNFLRQQKSNDDGLLIIDTEKFDTGKFDVVDPVNGQTIYKYTVVNQNFDVESDKRVAIDEVVSYEMFSGRAEFDVNLSSENINSQELAEAVNIDSSRITVNSDSITIMNVNSEDEIEFDTSAVDNGDYELVWNVTDTIDTAKVEVITGNRYIGDANFKSDLYSVNQGDKSNINLELVDSEVVEIQIGRDIYNHTVELRDSNSDGEIDFRFNTLTAGNENKPVEALNGTVITEQPKDENLSVDILAPITYTMEARIGSRTEDTAILDILPPETGSINTYELSADSNYGDLKELKDDVIRDDEIADHEDLALEIETSSIYSVIPENPIGSSINNGSVLDEEFGGEVSIEESSPSSINTPVEEYDLSEANSVYADSSENELWIVIDSDDLPNLDDSDTDKYSVETLNSYVANFEIDSDENPIFDDDVDIDQDFSIQNTVVKPSSRKIDTDSFGDDIHVLDIENQVIEFETNLADGRNITVIGESSTSDLSVFGTESVEDGMISYSVDGSNISMGDEFEIDVTTTKDNYEFVFGSSDLIKSVSVPESVYANEQFNVSAELNEDISNDEVDIEWSMDSLDTSTGPVATFEYPTSDVDSFDLDVSVSNNDQLLFESRSKSITIDERPPTPSPSLTSNKTGFIFSGNSVKLTTSLDNINSTDVEYEWILNGESISSSDNSITQELDSGMNQIEVNANYKGNTGKDSVSIYAYRSTPVSQSIFNYFV